MHFDIPANVRGKIKESQKLNKYLDLAKEPKKVENEVDSDINRS